ncbi:MAG: VOC family protein [Actinobacteria bacterium]|nr:VOC family protein [Actinomycetota bacterium]
MLGDHPIDVVLLAVDLEVAREFYVEKIGLDLLVESEHSLVLGCGGDSRLVISKSTVGTADEQTQAGFRVADLGAELEELRSRGVKIEDYDTPELKTQDGIADIGFALAAWFIDPGGNAIGILQEK